MATKKTSGKATAPVSPSWAGRKKSESRTAAPKKPALKTRLRFPPLSSGGASLEVSITNPLFLGSVPSGNITASGWVSGTPDSVTGWLVAFGNNVQPSSVNVTGTSWSMSFPNQPAGTYALFVRATLTSGGALHTALDQILIKVTF